MANTYETGNTITLRAQFTDVAGVPVNPDTLPQVLIYNNTFTLLSTYQLATENQKGVGLFEFNYTIPAGNVQTIYFYEFKGVLNGTVGLNRGQFMARFQV